MMHRFRVLLGLTIAAMLFSSLGQQPTLARTTTPTTKTHPSILGTLPTTERAKVIVHFTSLPLSLYSGGVSGLKATNPGTRGENRLAIQSPDSQNYLNYLTQQHNQFKQALATTINKAQVLAAYRIAFNGIALEVPTSEIEKLTRLPNVRLVEINQIYQPHTDSSIEFLGTPVFWNGLGDSDGANAGENIVVGVIDTGIYNPSDVLTTTGIHPSLTDPSPVGGEYDSRFSYKGVCADSDPQLQDGTFGPCNDKLIGAWWYNAGQIANAGEMHSPMDEDGHGTHTATTAVGNGGVQTPYGIASGMAPRGRLIMYKVCWSEDPADPEDGGCAVIDSVSAIEQAIIDNVDVINFSIGGGNNPWNSSTELAFLGATEAGISVNTSASNDGPETVEHEGPWVMTVAASTQDRSFIGLLTINGTDAPGPYYGASVTPGTLTGDLILAPAQNASDPTPSLCLEPYAPGTFAATDIVICRRGSALYVTKYANVFAGGAGAVIVGNAPTSSEAPNVDCGKICLNLDYLSTEAIVDYITSTLFTTATIQGGIPTSSGQGDYLASFSSTGPADTVNVLKPDISAIGVDVNAGITAFIWDDIYTDGRLYGLKNGTSMASPHVAGASALMRQYHPEWSVSEIKSALQTTAHAEIFVPGINRQATPFEQGSGRLEMAKAFSAALTLDETATNYLAANPDNGGDPRTLNIPSMINETCVEICSWTRTVRNRADVTTSWTASSTVTQGLSLDIEPAAFTLAAGATQTITITANVASTPLEAWIFGHIYLSENDNLAPAARMPVAVQSVLGEIPEKVEITTMQPSGSMALEPIITVSTNDLSTDLYGLIEATQIFTDSLIEDSTNGNLLDNLDDMLIAFTSAPTGTKRLVVEIVATSSPDLDVFVFLDLNSDSMPQMNELAYVSASAATLEKVDILDPYVGEYIILVQNYNASSSGTDSVQLAYAAVPGTASGNFSVNIPSSSSPDQPIDGSISWNIPTLQAGDIWYGAFDVGTSASQDGNIGTTRVDLRAFAQIYLPLVRK